MPLITPLTIPSTPPMMELITDLMAFQMASHTPVMVFLMPSKMPVMLFQSPWNTLTTGAMMLL